MTPEHLSPWALPLMAYRTLKTWVWLLLIGGVSFFKGGVAWWQLPALIALILLGVIAIGVRYWRFTYALEAQQLTINSGLFVKKARHIPYANIQTLERQQWFFLQPFGLETLSIETSSKDGKDGEGTLLAVPLSVAETIEARRHQHASATPETAVESAPAPEAVAPTTSYQINGHDLHLYALTSLGFLPLLAVLGAVWNRVDDLIPKALEDRALSLLAQMAVLALIGMAIFIVVVAILISYLSLVQRYWHFTLAKQAHTLVTTRGFFKQNTVSVRLARIQAARFKQSLLRQWLHLTTVQAITASNAADDEADNDLVLMPVVKTPQALETMHHFIDWLPAKLPAYIKIPSANAWLYSRNLVLGNLFVVVPLNLAVNVWLPGLRAWRWWTLLLSGLWLLLVALQGRYAAHHSGVAVIDDSRVAIMVGTGWANTQYILRRQNIQALTVANSIWMVKQHRVHLKFHIRRGDHDLELAVHYLDADTARQLQAWYQPANKNLIF